MVMARGVQQAGDQGVVGFFAAAQHDGRLAVVQFHEGARRAQADGAHQRVAHLVALLDLAAHEGAHRIRGAAASA